MQHAVDAEPDGERVLLRLEVNVGGAVLGRLEDHGVDEANEWRIRDAVVDLEVVGLILSLVCDELLLDGGARTESLGGANEPPDLALDVLARRDPDLERETGRQPELVDRVHVRRIRDRHSQGAVPQLVRDGDDSLQHVELHRLRRLGVDTIEGEVD